MPRINTPHYAALLRSTPGTNFSTARMPRLTGSVFSIICEVCTALSKLLLAEYECFLSQAATCLNYRGL